MKKVAAILFALVLSGCASEIMQGYVGRDITDVIVQYGPPSNVFEMPDGRVAFQWSTSTPIIMPTTTTYNVHDGYGYSTTTGGYVGDQTCVYTFFAQPNSQNSHTVVDFQQPDIMCE